MSYIFATPSKHTNFDANQEKFIQIAAVSINFVKQILKIWFKKKNIQQSWSGWLQKTLVGVNLSLYLQAEERYVFP